MFSNFWNYPKHFSHRLSVGNFKKSTKEPPKPFHTSRLLQVASNVLHMSPKNNNGSVSKAISRWVYNLHAYREYKVF